MRYPGFRWIRLFAWGGAVLALGACSLGGSEPTPVPRSTPSLAPAPTVTTGNTPTSVAINTVVVVTTTQSVPTTIPTDIPTAVLTPEATSSPVSTALPTTVPTSVPTVAPTAIPTPTVPPLPEGYRRFTSRINPYSIGYPQGWRAEGDAFRFGDVRGDLFSRQTADGPVSVNVLSESLQGSELDTEEYARLNVRQIRETGVESPERAGEIAVGGSRAVLIQWQDRSRPQRVYEITQAVWAEGDRGWVVTLATPQGERERYLPVLREMLGTFTLRSP